ncbi:MAG: hypothetical protein D6808_08085 [Candidatus Dadabacteria bacterium]|nr:MAG: hypothetical protein D6808_08085 [Candidatus Dadabacteria bacterium]
MRQVLAGNFQYDITEKFFGLGLPYDEYDRAPITDGTFPIILKEHENMFYETFTAFLNQYDGLISIYSTSKESYQIVERLKNSSFKDRLFAHYSENHDNYDSFHKSPWTGPTDALFSKTRGILHLVSPSEYIESIRFWKNNYPTGWDIIFPYMPDSCYPLKALEDPTPTFVWLMQYAGTLRMLPPLHKLAAIYERRMLRSRSPVWYTPRYIANLKGNYQDHSRENVASDPVLRLMKEYEHLPNPTLDQLQDRWVQLIANMPYYHMAYAHEFIDFQIVSQLPDIKCIALIRDPRDMLISYLYRMSLHPDQLTEDHPYHYQKELRRILLGGLSWDETKERILNYLIDGGVFSKSTFQFVYWPSLKQLTQSFIHAWRASNTYAVKYEDLRAKPLETYKALLEWLNWRPCYPPLSDAELEEVIYLGTFQAQTNGRMKDNESNYRCTVWDPKTGCPVAARRGGIKQWKEDFSPQIKERVKRLIGEELIELGYESSLDW